VLKRKEMKFTFKKEDDRGEATIVFKSDSLEEVVTEFEKFLRATGFDLGESTFALVNFSDMEAMLEDNIDFSDEEDEEGGSGGGNEGDSGGDNGKH
jgi:hypothetical protein